MRTQFIQHIKKPSSKKVVWGGYESTKPFDELGNSMVILTSWFRTKAFESGVAFILVTRDNKYRVAYRVGAGCKLKFLKGVKDKPDQAFRLLSKKLLKL